MEFTPLQYIPEPDTSLSKEPLTLPPKPVLKKKRKLVVIGIVCAVVVILSFLRVYIVAPDNFPNDSMVTVKRGETLSGVAEALKSSGVIKSRKAFKALVVILKGERGLAAGDYYLEKSQNVVTLAWRFTKGSYGLKNVKITIPEGLNVNEIASLISKESRFTRFDREEFVKTASMYEGYLFPDTYLFLPNITAGGVVDAMLLNYQKRIETLALKIKLFGRPIKDVMNMASIIEEEARTEETRRIIAGILWKRLDDGMPLQVDAAFVYVNGKKDSMDLTSDDLKIDSPYNTYIHAGFPPTPIANPGLKAILATINPIATKYYYYLSDEEGEMHYAVTHDGHLANKQKYLSF